MSAKNEKKIRRAAKKEARRIIGRAMKDPFWVRLKVAWRMLIGR